MSGVALKASAGGKAQAELAVWFERTCSLRAEVCEYGNICPAQWDRPRKAEGQEGCRPPCSWAWLCLVSC